MARAWAAWWVATLAGTGLAGCGPDYSPDTYASSAVQQANKVERGIVIGVRRVDVSAGGAVGAASGAAAGGALGSTAPGGSVTSTFGAVGGALIGGLIGTGTEHVVADTTAWEYIVRKPSGELVSVTQRDAAALPLGQKVLVIAGSQARIVPDYTVDAADPAPSPSPKPDQPPAIPAPVTTAPLPDITGVPPAANAVGSSLSLP